MVEKVKRHLSDLILGFILGTLISLFPAGYIVFDKLMTPVPYGEVQLLSKVEHEGYTDYTFSHVKYQCVFKKLVVFGVNFGILTPLEWEDPVTQTTNRDRLAGKQILSLRVFDGGIRYSSIEIRTRHDCDGQTVDRIYYAG